MTIGMQITTTGGTPLQRELVTNVMARGLVEVGFSNVALVNTVGEPMVGSDVPSMMDNIRETDPSFLNTPIRIWSIEETDPLKVFDSEQEAKETGTGSVAVAMIDEDTDGRLTSITIHEPQGGIKAQPLNRGSFGNTWLPKTRAADQAITEALQENKAAKHLGDAQMSLKMAEDETKYEQELNADFERTKAAAEAAATPEESNALWLAHQEKVDKHYGLKTTGYTGGTTEANDFANITVSGTESPKPQAIVD